MPVTLHNTLNIQQDQPRNSVHHSPVSQNSTHFEDTLAVFHLRCQLLAPPLALQICLERAILLQLAILLQRVASLEIAARWRYTGKDSSLCCCGLVLNLHVRMRTDCAKMRATPHFAACGAVLWCLFPDADAATLTLSLQGFCVILPFIVKFVQLLVLLLRRHAVLLQLFVPLLQLCVLLL